jgi:hypothetical protein
MEKMSIADIEAGGRGRLPDPCGLVEPRPEDREKTTLLDGLFYDHEYDAGVRNGYDPFALGTCVGRPRPAVSVTNRPGTGDLVLTGRSARPSLTSSRPGRCWLTGYAAPTRAGYGRRWASTSWAEYAAHEVALSRAQVYRLIEISTTA